MMQFGGRGSHRETGGETTSELGRSSRSDSGPSAIAFLSILTHKYKTSSRAKEMEKRKRGARRKREDADCRLERHLWGNCTQRGNLVDLGNSDTDKKQGGIEMKKKR